MIVGLEGIIEKKEPTYIELNVSGVIYGVSLSLNCSSKIIDDKIKLFIVQIIKEDSDLLFGFLDINEKLLFNTVIKINGIGSKVALAICSTFTPNEFLDIISNQDIDMLKKVPGIGPRSGSRILMELNGLIFDISDNSGNAKAKIEASMALESLGFKKDIISKIISTCTSTTTAEIVKEGLKKLQGNR